MDEVQSVIGSICKPNHSWGVVFCPNLTASTRPTNVRQRRIAPQNQECRVQLAKPKNQRLFIRLFQESVLSIIEVAHVIFKRVSEIS